MAEKDWPDPEGFVIRQQHGRPGGIGLRLDREELRRFELHQHSVGLAFRISGSILW